MNRSGEIRIKCEALERLEREFGRDFIGFIACIGDLKRVRGAQESAVSIINLQFTQGIAQGYRSRQISTLERHRIVQSGGIVIRFVRTEELRRHRFTVVVGHSQSGQLWNLQSSFSRKCAFSDIAFLLDGNKCGIYGVDDRSDGVPIETCKAQREPAQPRYIQISILFVAVLIGNGARKGFKVPVCVSSAGAKGAPAVNFKIGFHHRCITDARENIGPMQFIKPELP